MTSGRARPWTSLFLLGLLVGLSAAVGGCGGGDDGPQGPPGPIGPPGPEGPPGEGPDTVLGPYDPLPGVHVDIVSVTGGTGPTGNFQVGDVITVRFTLRDAGGTNLNLAAMDSGQITFSGPSFNYQRVIPTRTDLRALSLHEGGGVWAYTYPVAIPASYAAPYNDTAAYGPDEGELTGQALLDGTYTVGITIYETYVVGTDTFRDAGSDTFDVRFGLTALLEPREVVLLENCEKCHTEVRAHGGGRVGVKVCLLCHTSGSEDRNTAGVPADDPGTPGASIDFKVMIHKIHSGHHLPSVQGVATLPSGLRDYAAPPRKYQLVGFNNSVLDFSHVGFPVMPSAYVAYLYDQTGTNYVEARGNGPMPRDAGFGALPAPARLQEDKIRTGVVSCESCHAGAAQESLWHSQPSRMACGSCHDDIDWLKPYSANGHTMPPQPVDGACLVCHPSSGNLGDGKVGTIDAHRHPYKNPALNTGVNVLVTAVGGGTGGGGRHQLADRVTATFSVENDGGVDLNVNALQRFQAIVTGPTGNPSALAGNVTMFDNTFRRSSPFTGNGTISTPAVGAGAVDQVLAVVFTGPATFDVVGSVSGTLLTGQAPGGPVTAAGVTFTVTAGATPFAADDRWYLEVVPTAASYTKSVPTDVPLEHVGVATGGAQTVNVANLPLYWGRQTVFERTAIQAGAGISAAAPSLSNFVVVDTALVPGIAVGDRVVLDAGGGLLLEEYLVVGRVQTTSDENGVDLGAADRIWFTTALRFGHAPGAQIREVTLSSRREGTAYTVTDPATGALALVAGQFTAGNPVVVSYRTDVRFGRFRAPTDVLQGVYPPAMADSEEIGVSWGDWKGLPFAEGTYTVGFWVNRDFSVSGNVAADGEATSYRMISPPAVLEFLFGASPAGIEPWPDIVSDQACNACHGDLQFHGNGRRGVRTCLNCHRLSGMEDGPKWNPTSSGGTSFANWYVPPTPGVAMEFRQLIHKYHMGPELPDASTYEVVGVFLGVPYVASVEHFGFPDMVEGAAHCAKCHGAGSTSWHQPLARDHASSPVATRVWRAACGSCHDTPGAFAHFETQTPAGVELCEMCHGDGADYDVVRVHFPR